MAEKKASEVKKRTIDPAAAAVLKRAEAEGFDTMFSRAEGMRPCPMGDGSCCKLCMMGQAGVQGHYNPDRITTPMMRTGGSLTPISWDKALGVLEEKLGKVSGDRFAWFTGTISGHQSVLLTNHLDAMGSTNHYAHEIVNNAVSRAVNQDMLGEANPRLRLDKAKMIVSFGADFMGASQSPVHYAGQYAKFRTNKDRGLLVQIESKMSLTGGSADLWLAIKSGTEQVLALGIDRKSVV